MLINKAVVACWLPFLVALCIGTGCLLDSPKSNTLPRRTTYPPLISGRLPDATNPGSNPSPVPAQLASETKGTEKAGTATEASSNETGQASADSERVVREPPVPRMPSFHSQTTAEVTGAGSSLAVAMNEEQNPPPNPPVQAPAPAPKPPVQTPDPQPTTNIFETTRPSAKVPMPPDNDLDPPPMPTGNTPVRTSVPSSDLASPPPIPSVVKPSLSPTRIVPTSAVADSLPQLRELHNKAVKRYSTMDSYVARFKRKEQINGKDKPEELMLFKFRKSPWSVYFKWLGIEGKNRECVYVKDHHGGLIHTLLAEGDVLLMPAGKHFSLAPDSPLVKARTRHPITEAGIGEMITRFGQILDAMEHNDKKYGTMKYLGPLQRPEFEKPHLAVEQAIPPGAETALPKGGSRVWLFDPDNGLPVLLITTDSGGQMVEYYCYDQLLYPVKLDDDDFNPDKLWKPR